MSLDGTAIPDFADFVLATRSHKITPTTEILNDCARRSYITSLMLKGRGNDEVVQTGKEIIDQIQLKKMQNAGFYRPNQNLQPKGVDTLTTVTAPWRFHQGNYAWTNEQVKLQLSAGGNPSDVYTRLKTSWEQACDLDIWDSLEDAWIATPSNADMEATDGLQPYSIDCFVTNDGLAPSGFTTVMGVNPTTETRWRNQYGTVDWSARGTNDALYIAFDEMWRKLRWKRIRGFNQSVGSPAQDFQKMKIVTSPTGVNGYLALNRDSNDRLRRPNDAGYGDDPTFNNIELVDIEAYDDFDTTATPHFRWLDFDYLFPVFHGERYMTEEGPIRGSVNQPFSWAVYKNTYLNLFCRSRRRLGKIYTT